MSATVALASRLLFRFIFRLICCSSFLFSDFLLACLFFVFIFRICVDTAVRFVVSFVDAYFLGVYHMCFVVIILLASLDKRL